MNQAMQSEVTIIRRQPSLLGLGARAGLVPLPSELGDVDWDAADAELRAARRLADVPDISRVLDALRLCMASMPSEQRDSLSLRVSTWKALYPRGFLETMRTFAQVRGEHPGTALPDDAEMSVADDTLFEVACGLRAWDAASAYREMFAALAAEVQALRNGSTEQGPRGVVAHVGYNRRAEYARLIRAAHALMGTEEWSCAELVEHAAVGVDEQAAALRAALRVLRLESAHDLGLYLRSFKGKVSDGLVLVRTGRNANHVALWSIASAA